ncbi:MAG: class I SAM-dependent methyltransferase [Acidimicrobiales bacterium]
MPENYFVGSVASGYKAKWPHLFAPAVVDPAVDFLAARAGAGPVLELGLGTGRLALPLSRTGLTVHGIELSSDMVAQLRNEEGADAVSVTMGDFSTTAVQACRGSVTLAYLVRNTIMNLTTQDAQVACFANVAAHLAPGGVFVMEVMVPELQRLPPGETVRAFTVTPTHVGFEEYDVARQRSTSHHYWIDDDRVETFSAPFRYVWPAELDLMARLAGMSLRERWNDWDQSPFTSDSRSHVSVWELPPEPAGT